MATLETTVRPLDDKVRPVLHNSQAQALDEFLTNFDDYLHERFGTRTLDKDAILPEILKNAAEGAGNGEKLTQSQMLQLAMLKKDKYRREIASQAMDTEALKAFADDVLRRVDSIDLKSYSFDKDPDLKLA